VQLCGLVCFLDTKGLRFHPLSRKCLFDISAWCHLVLCSHGGLVLSIFKPQGLRFQLLVFIESNHRWWNSSRWGFGWSFLDSYNQKVLSSDLTRTCTVSKCPWERGLSFSPFQRESVLSLWLSHLVWSTNTIPVARNVLRKGHPTNMIPIPHPVWSTNTVPVARNVLRKGHILPIWSRSHTRYGLPIPSQLPTMFVGKAMSYQYDPGPTSSMVYQYHPTFLQCYLERSCPTNMILGPHPVWSTNTVPLAWNVLWKGHALPMWTPVPHPVWSTNAVPLAWDVLWKGHALPMWTPVPHPVWSTNTVPLAWNVLWKGHALPIWTPVPHLVLYRVVGPKITRWQQHLLLPVLILSQ
jgi:hypothetical protein